MIWLLLALLGSGHPKQVDVGHVELNHTFNEKGKLAITQMIYWDWDKDNGFFVRTWHTFKGEVYRDANGSRYFFVKIDIQSVRVRAKHFKETFTQYDPEREDNKKHGQRFRRGTLSHLFGIPDEEAGSRYPAGLRVTLPIIGRPN